MNAMSKIKMVIMMFSFRLSERPIVVNDAVKVMEQAALD